MCLDSSREYRSVNEERITLPQEEDVIRQTHNMLNTELNNDAPDRPVPPHSPSAIRRGLAAKTHRNWHVTVDEDYIEYFSSALEKDDAYDWFLQQPGTTIKNEPRTRIKVFSRPCIEGPNESISFFLKEYSTPFVASIARSLQTPKAKREYWALKQCRTMGIPAVEPVAYGLRRDRAGTLRSSFIITRQAENVIDFRSWLKQQDERRMGAHKPTVFVVRRVARYLRTVHEESFFLIRPAPKNILLQDADSTHPEPLFVDLEYARFISPFFATRYGQRMDLGMFIGPFIKWNNEEILNLFLEAYSPDPFRRSDEELRRFILRASQIRLKRTPLAFAGHRAARIMRVCARKIRGKDSRNISD